MLGAVILDVAVFKRSGGAHLVDVGIVGGPHVDAGLLAEFEAHVVAPVDVGSELDIGVAEEAVCVLVIGVMFGPPVGIGKR